MNKKAQLPADSTNENALAALNDITETQTPLTLHIPLHLIITGRSGAASKLSAPPEGSCAKVPVETPQPQQSLCKAWALSRIRMPASTTRCSHPIVLIKHRMPQPSHAHIKHGLFNTQSSSKCLVCMGIGLGRTHRADTSRGHGDM